MGRKVRQGNDLPVEWTLLDGDGHAYVVEGKSFAIDLIVGSRKFRIQGATASSNVISFIYYGKDQKATGDVVLVYTENGGQTGMVTYDVENAFTIVPHSWQAVDSDETPETVTVESVQITSTISDPSCPVERGTGANGVQQKGTGANATGPASFAEGSGAKAEGFGSHAEGMGTTASGMFSHAEGQWTTANKDGAHAEGYSAVASGKNSHAEGDSSAASGRSAHAEGDATKATARSAHAEGMDTTAGGANSHAEGYGTQATNQSEHAEGRYNASHDGTIHSVGIGANSSNRKNAVEVMYDGSMFVFGVGEYDGTNPEGSMSLAAVLADLTSRVTTLENNQ